MWQPLEKVPAGSAIRALAREQGDTADPEVWSNDIYECIVRRQPGMSWISIKRYDRGSEIPWRHKQQIKNETCGLLAEGIELFPAEDRLADTANEYHLWVLDPGERIPLGFGDGAVVTDEQAEIFTNDPSHKGRQEPWEEGLTTGRNGYTPLVSEEQFSQLKSTLSRINAAP